MLKIMWLLYNWVIELWADSVWLKANVQLDKTCFLLQGREKDAL